MLKIKKELVLRGAMLALSLVSTQAFAARVASVTGSLPRNLSDNQFTVQIVISEISEAEQQALTTAAADSATSTIAKRFEFRLNGNSTPVPFAEDPNSTVNFYATEDQVPDEQQASGATTTWTHTYVVRFNGMNTNSALADLAGTSKAVTLEFDFLLAEGKEVNSEKITLKQDSYVIAAKPEYMDIGGTQGSHKSVTVSFKIPAGDVDALGSAAKKPATQVSIWVVDSTIVTTASLNGKIYSGSDAEDAATTCTLTVPGADNGDCVVCPENNTYLDEAGQNGILYRKVDVKAGSATFSNLENGRRYFAFMQYEPDGIQRSQCLVGIPSPTHTVTELNGAGEATVVDFRCFIATAAYGTPLDAKVGHFRKFRDEVLLRTPGGRALVNFYYSVSPPLADFIAERPKLRSFVRAVLDIPASVLEKADQYY